MKVLVLDNINGVIREQELNITGGSSYLNYISGLQLQSINGVSIRINRGEVVINGNYHTLSYYKTIPISDFTFFPSPNTRNTGLFWVYVKDKGGGELDQTDFYLSEYQPNADCYNKHTDINIYNNNAMYLYDYQEYRCIGAIYAIDLSNSNVLKFDLAYLGYYESKWTSFNSSENAFNYNDVNLLKHALGMPPKNFDIWFKPNINATAKAFNNYYSSGGWWVSAHGVSLYGRFTQDEIQLRAGRRIYYYDSDGYTGWFNTGFFKLITRAF